MGQEEIMTATDIDRNARSEIDAQIDAWIEATRALTGKIVEERKPWTTLVTEDAIRHFAQGTDDDNPLWGDAAYAKKSRFGAITAPPAFVFANRYPILHGAPMKAPLASLIGGVEVEWHLPMRAGDQLRSEPRQKDFYEKKNKDGRRLNFVISEVKYWNQDQQCVATAQGTMIMATQVGMQTMMEHSIPRYSDTDLTKLERTWKEEYRRGGQMLRFEDVEVGAAVPAIVRGPLTIGDMVAWNAAIGPSYKAGRWGYLDLLRAMHTAMVNPATGFPVKYSQQHEDFNMAAGRGMPAPFDNGVMRFAWVAPLITNWMGDHGDLVRLNVTVRRPGLYGDLVTYSGKVTGKDAGRDTVTVEITGTKQDGSVTTAGQAEVRLPRRP
jgi:acyl dehydratase